MSNELKKIVILFNGAHLSYSPTVIGLYDLLSNFFDVTIIANHPSGFNNQPLLNRKVIYLKEMQSSKQYRINDLHFSVLALFYPDFFILKREKLHLENFYEYFWIKRQITKIKPNFIIAVDFKNLFYAELMNKKVEFLSLEIIQNDNFYQVCKKENINSVIIQTKERYQHLFEEKQFKTFFIQNAPNYIEFGDHPDRNGLVYCGTAWNRFGFYHCLELLREYSEYYLTVKGAILEEDMLKIKNDYSDILNNNQLILDNDYLDDIEVVDYLRRFKVGLCFYNFEVAEVNTFNYYSAPSGKMFKYFAAGVPVIGIEISGLYPVKEFDCGVLIKDLNPQSIKKAIDMVEANFEYYSANCLKAAKYYSFDNASKPFLNHLLQSEN